MGTLHVKKNKTRQIKINWLNLIVSIYINSLIYTVIWTALLDEGYKCRASSDANKAYLNYPSGVLLFKNKQIYI